VYHTTDCSPNRIFCQVVTCYAFAEQAMDGSHGGGAPPPIWSDADDFFTMPAGSETLIPDAVDTRFSAPCTIHRAGAGAEHHRSGSCGLSDGVAVDPGIVLDDGVAAGSVAQEWSNGVQTGVAPVGMNGDEDGFTPEGASGTSDSSIPDSSGYKRR
jgi:hypothetical protein